ncbi:MAG: S8 family peptidase [Aquabacterium sp.]
MPTTLRFRSAARCLLVATLLAGGGANAFQRPDRMAAQADASGGLTDRVIVKYKDAGTTSAPSSDSLSGARQAGNRWGVAISHHRRMFSGADVLKLDHRLAGTQLKNLLADMKRTDSNIEYIEPDRILYPMGLTPNDPFYNQQWSLFDSTGGINAPNAWDLSTGAGVVVAVVDTGVLPHADLVSNLLPGYDFISTTQVSNDGNGRDSDASDPGDNVAAHFCSTGSAAQNSSWHGTHVSGIIAATANNATGVIGVAYNAKILPVRVLGRCGGYTSDIADGIVWAAGGTVSGVPANSRPAKVINMSLGGPGACDTTTQTAISRARSLGAVVIVAAGNLAGDASQSTPSGCSGVVSVAATGLAGGRAYYSNYGSSVSLAAPGGDPASAIVSTVNAGASAPTSDSYASYMGTSMAAPHVSAVAALMLARNATLTPDQIATMLTSTVRAFPADCSGCGAGIVDAYAAVSAAASAYGATPVVPEVEPNNTLATAQAIASTPSIVTGSIKAASDTDYYKVTVPASSKLRVALSPNFQSNYDLWVYDASGDLSDYSINGSGLTDEVTISNTTRAGVVYYLRVVRTSGLTGATGTYTLNLSR